MRYDNKGSSLILAMLIVIIISLLAFSILEYIIPFSRDIKGIENSSKAYYQANSGIEEGLYYISTRTNEKTETGTIFSGNESTEYSTFSSGSFLPPSGEGNSDYDLDWNTISPGNPIQLSIGNGYISDWTNVEIAFRVPDLDGVGINDETLSGGTLQIVNWQLSASNNVINAYFSGATDNLINSSEVCKGNATPTCSGILLNGLQGIDLDGNTEPFNIFYNNSCNGTSSGCTLKFSVINKLETTDSISVPYLEWQFNFGINELPLRYTKIDSAGKSYLYKKNLEVKVPSQTVNEAFDFTVFQ